LVSFQWAGGMGGNPINNLAAGNYTVTITNNNLCKAVFTYTVTEPDAIELTINQTNTILCYGDDDASLQAVAAGGTPNYTYNWSNGTTGAIANNLAPGVYSATVTDSKGCKTITNTTITEPAELTVYGTPTGTLCTGDNTGRIAAFGSGGTLTTGYLQYSIDGQNWQGGNLFAGLTAGVYTLSVQDQNGCVVDSPVVIQDANPFFISSFTADTTIEYLEEMEVMAMVNDTAGVTYTWYQINNGGTLITDSTYNFTITPSDPLVYQFTATNENGCEVDSIVQIEVEKPRRANAPTGFTPNGDGANDYFYVQGDEKVGSVTIFRVYDRWGEMVFEGQNLEVNVEEQGWNGTFRGQPASSGVYTWYADVLFLDGETIQIKGDITLLR
jgi:gliding motility-associated-like protein